MHEGHFYFYKPNPALVCFSLLDSANVMPPKLSSYLNYSFLNTQLFKNGNSAKEWILCKSVRMTWRTPASWASTNKTLPFENNREMVLFAQPPPNLVTSFSGTCQEGNNEYSNPRMCTGVLRRTLPKNNISNLILYKRLVLSLTPPKLQVDTPREKRKKKQVAFESANTHKERQPHSFKMLNQRSLKIFNWST